MQIGSETVFWHACRKVDLERILQDGLVPSASKSRSVAIYLTDDRFTAENYANFDPDAEGVVLGIQAIALDTAHLGIDDHEFPEIFQGMSEDALAQRGWDSYTDWRDLDWKASLSVSNQVTYDAAIPPGAITVHELSFGRDPISP